MKLVKLFGIVVAVHAAVFMFVFAIPGCRSTAKKSVATAPVIGGETSPLGAADTAAPATTPAAPADFAGVRFSPTRPGTSAAVEATATPPAAVAASSEYTVSKGDTLWSIAKKNSITVKQLAAANKIHADTPLKLGQKLTIPGKNTEPAAMTKPASAPAASSSSSITHVVKSGETLGVIAKKYQVKVGDIATANNIADPTKLRVGQTLKIPGWQSTGAKTAKAPATVAPAAAPVPAPAPVPAAPVSPLFEASPIESAPAAPATGESPFITPAAESQDAPVIRVEQSGSAPRIE
ncbi:MAG: LysM peptidoglycan-binding domain-containing protein [Opitutaceae bacterium]|jgi:LysM repeat protein